MEILHWSSHLTKNIGRKLYATIYNNGLGTIQQVYFPNTNPKFKFFNAPISNNQSTSSFLRQPARRQSQQYYVQSQQFHSPPFHFYSKAAMGNLPFNS